MREPDGASAVKPQVEIAQYSIAIDAESNGHIERGVMVRDTMRGESVKSKGMSSRWVEVVRGDVRIEGYSEYSYILEPVCFKYSLHAASCACTTLAPSPVATLVPPTAEGECGAYE